MRALINISIERLTNNINADLPAPVFGLNDFWNSYFDNIQRQLPYDIELKDVSFLKQSVRLWYKGPGGDDYLLISCNEIGYPSLLSSTAFNEFEIENIGYTISKMNLASKQFIQKVNISNISLFGKTIIDSYTPNQYRNDTVKLNDFIDIPLKQKINADRCFNTKIVYSGIPLSSHSINLSLTIKK